MITEKPELDIKDLEGIAVNTQGFNEYFNLMKIFRLADLKWGTGLLPTEKVMRNRVEGEIYIAVSQGTLSCGNLKETSDSYKIYSFKQFCEENNITQEKLNEIDYYYFD